jgi:hypothetical protein
MNSNNAKADFPGVKTDTPPGGVSWWFKQDEIHQATHVHGGPEFLPWHREITNRFEELLRQINPQSSLHYWDFKDDPRKIPNGNIGGGNTGEISVFRTGACPVIRCMVCPVSRSILRGATSHELLSI